MGAVKSYPSRELTRLRREWVQSKQRYVVLMAAFYVAVSIALQSADLDHVVVTREGGVVVLDSKFRTDLTSTQVADMVRAAARARSRAEAPAGRAEVRARRSAPDVTDLRHPAHGLAGPSRRSTRMTHSVIRPIRSAAAGH